MFILLDASDRVPDERAFEERMLYDKQKQEVAIYYHLDFEKALHAKGDFAAIQEIVIEGVLKALKKFNLNHKVVGFDFDTFYYDLKDLLQIKHVLNIAA